MTQKDFGDILAVSGYPVAYLAFPANECPQMPFVVFQETGSNNVGADGIVYKKVKVYQVDLLTADKDETAEAALEAAFEQAGIFWNKYQTIDDNEACQRYTYTIEVLGG